MYHNVRDKFGRFAKKKSTKKVKATPKKPTTPKHILSVFLLDDSSSMATKVYPTINGFNLLLTKGKEDAKNEKVFLHERLAKFSTSKEFHWTSFVDQLSAFSYRPNGYSTALWDAVGQAIKNTEETLKMLPSNTQVLLNIFTDGEENSSVVWNVNTINARIKEKQDQGWTITFIGAGDKASVQKVAHDAGIFASNTMNYTNNVAGTQSAFASVVNARSAYVKNVKKGKAVKEGFFSN